MINLTISLALILAGIGIVISGVKGDNIITVISDYYFHKTSKS